MKKLNIIFIIAFIGLLLAPAVLMPAFKNQTNTEKRELHEFPKVKENNKLNRGYFLQLDDWVNDHIGFRKQLINANSTIMTRVFNHSTEESVILGKNGWLFYNETLNDYTNNPTISEKNATNIAKTMKIVQKSLASENKAFTLAVIPNKNSVYSKYMPFNYYIQPTKGSYELLIDALEKEQVNYSDVRGNIQKSEEILYQTGDSHWTYKGALLGYQTIMDSLGINYNKFDGINFIEKKDWSGDLTEMLYGTTNKYCSQVYPDYNFNYEIISHEKAVDSLILETYNEKGNGKLTMFRDSFSNTMQVYFQENFKETYLSRAFPYRVDTAMNNDSDAIVFEIVERNIANLARRAPVMEAPSVKLDINATKFSDYVAYASDYNEQLIHVYGAVDKSIIENDYDVYIIVMNGNEVVAYEAFPIYEQELLGAKNLEDNGFSAYLDANSLDEISTIYAVVKSGDKYYATDSIRIEQ